MKSDEFGWVVRYVTQYGMCCPNQKVGEGGVPENSSESKKCSKSLFWEKFKKFQCIRLSHFNGISSKYGCQN